MTAPEQPSEIEIEPEELDPSFLSDDELALIVLWMMED